MRVKHGGMAYNQWLQGEQDEGVSTAHGGPCGLRGRH
jgi:hypothetical protein